MVDSRKKGSCGGTPRVGRKGDPKPRRGGRRRNPQRRKRAVRMGWN